MQETRREGPALRSPAAWARFLVIIAAGTALDLATKAWAYMALGNPRTVYPEHRLEEIQRHLPGLDLVWSVNHGAAFGQGQGYTGLLTAFTALALVLLVYLFADSRRRQFALQAFLALIVAGALGNLYDRIVFGYVRDFLRFSAQAEWATWDKLQGYIWPFVFNVADVFITVGVVGLFAVWLVAMFRHGHQEPAAAAATKAAKTARK